MFTEKSDQVVQLNYQFTKRIFFNWFCFYVFILFTLNTYFINKSIIQCNLFWNINLILKDFPFKLTHLLTYDNYIYFKYFHSFFYYYLQLYIFETCKLETCNKEFSLLYYLLTILNLLFTHLCLKVYFTEFYQICI